MILEKDGHQVVEAEHGEAALAHLPSLLPDIVTTDLTMPVLDGEGLIERIRSEPRTASIPIVVVSGNPAAARALRESGLVEAVVLKPFEAAELAECIRAIANRFTLIGPVA
jgi:CheY-like chemotaxis protein